MANKHLINYTTSIVTKEITRVETTNYFSVLYYMFSLLQMFRIKSFQARRITSVNSLWWERKDLCFRNRIKVIGAESGENERENQEVRTGGVGKG